MKLTMMMIPPLISPAEGNEFHVIRTDVKSSLLPGTHEIIKSLGHVASFKCAQVLFTKTMYVFLIVA